MPRTTSFHATRRRCDVLPRVLDAIGFQRGLLLGHSDGASIAAIYAGSVQDHRVRGLVLIAPHFFTEEMGLTEIRRARQIVRCRRAARKAQALARRRRLRLPLLERAVARSGLPQVGYHRSARLYPRADPDRAGRRRSIRHAQADRGGASRNASVRSRRRCCRASATCRYREAPELTLKAVADFINRLLRDHHEGEDGAGIRGCRVMNYSAY